MSNWFQWAIVAFIIFSILFHVWKGGASNPVGTGRLQHDVSNIRQQVTALGSRVGHVEDDMKEMKEESASTKDVERIEEVIEGKLATLRAEMSGHRQLSDATNRSVQRIEKMLIERALGK